MRRAGLVVALLLVAAGCARGPLLDRAIAARGGPLPGLVRDVAADVHEGFPGAWRWRTAFQVPDHYCWSVETNHGLDHYCDDGVTTRAFVGARLVSQDPAAGTPLRTQTRFFAVIGLDALRGPGVTLTPLPAGTLGPDVVEALEAVFTDDGARYRLGFDARGLLVTAAGPVNIDPVGKGDITARFADFQPAGDWLLPRRATWTFGDVPLAEETVRAVCPDPSGLDAAAFRDPSRLPPCPPR